MTLGAINHVALTVSHLDRADESLAPVFEFLGYRKTEEMKGLSIWESQTTGTAVNLWQARPELRDHEHMRYAPGLHHLAFNASSREQVDALYDLLARTDLTILDAPAEYDYAPGYYAVFFEGPDRIKFELVYIHGLTIK